MSRCQWSHKDCRQSQASCSQANLKGRTKEYCLTSHLQSINLLSAQCLGAPSSVRGAGPLLPGLRHDARGVPTSAGAPSFGGGELVPSFLLFRTALQTRHLQWGWLSLHPPPLMGGALLLARLMAGALRRVRPQLPGGLSLFPHSVAARALRQYERPHLPGGLSLPARFGGWGAATTGAAVSAGSRAVAGSRVGERGTATGAATSAGGLPLVP
jgi:hypothetical protein